MRPLRAFATLCVLLGIWGSWRFGEASAAYAALLAARSVIAAPSSPLPLALIESDEAVWSSASPKPARRLPLLARPTQPGAGAPGMFAHEMFALAAQSASGAAPPSNDPAFVAAEGAYAALARGDRRQAAARFETALAAAPAHPNARFWRAELKQLRKRWNFEAYSLLREGGGPVAATRQPLLGGGQSGARAGYTLGPLARRPVEIFGRLNIAQHWAGFDGESAQAAIGAAWQPFGRRGPSLSAERLIGIGGNGRDAFAARVAGGAAHVANAKLPVDLSAYAEAGVVGLKRRDAFIGGQAYAMYPVFAGDKTRVTLGAGVWGSAQDSVSRAEIGPAAQIARRFGTGSIEVRAEYRVRIAGDAAPGSGPAVTIATRF